MIVVEREIAGKLLKIETGKVARQSAGSVVVTYGETTIIVAVNAAKEIREGIDYFPLQVEYRERYYAGGKIPGGFFKREARPADREVLTSRLTDRPIRPLFPKAFRYETQVIITALSSDGENMADTLAGVGASAALLISNIPWNGPLATVRVGMINGEYIVNPTRTQMEDSTMELIVSGNDKTIVMVEGEAKEISEESMVEALKVAHKIIIEMIDLQNELLAQCTVVKREIPVEETDAEFEKQIIDSNSDKIQSTFKISNKIERDDAYQEIIATFVESLDDGSDVVGQKQKFAKKVLADEYKNIVRENILESGVRIDNRSTTEIRPITIDTGYLHRTHGSSLFTRGETQALAVVTLGTKSDQQIIDDMDNDYKKSFMLHYNFPPYCVGETGRIGFTSRREVGHGNLAERSLKPVLPSTEDFPYTIRIVSEIMESNGSSSMASVCGGSLSLMDAGVPTKAHVAGIAMGLITDGKRHAILSDILGTEDHLGDMDFKVAGTREGITAIQLDLKIEGVSFELLTEALAQAKEGRYHILGLMEEAMPTPHKEISQYAPQIQTLQINPEKIGALIGPGGKNIKKIIADTECNIEVDDTGTVFVSSPNRAKCNDALELVRAITMEPEVGMEFDGTITRLMTFGAFVEFVPGREGLIHISNLEWNRVNQVEDVVKSGDKVRVKLIKVDDQGRLDFSRKALLPQPEGYVEPERRPQRPRDKPFKKRF
ncbi:MAG: polyribonucleotide nucleotidyltransferase [Candidatus Marinimicrobia bacterium]|nr:polyribonucleotide nucleotidyltransferase [Candidatus Neomarinimicrobiota bacterium]